MMESEVDWITDGAEIADLIYGLEANETFAFRFQLSYGPCTKYAAVTGGPYRETRNYSETTLAEPYDTVAEIEKRREPSADEPLPASISHDPETDTVYLHRGPGRYTEITAVTTDTLAVDYSATGHLAACCDECGLTHRIPVTEDDLPMRGGGMLEGDDGDLITPCCRSQEWTSVVETE